MSNLLSQNDKAICENIAKTGTSIDAKRAKALLLLDEGISHAKTAESSTLSVGQVRYVLTKYKSIGIAFFPAELVVLKENTTPVTDIIKKIDEITATEDTQVIKNEYLVDTQPIIEVVNAEETITEKIPQIVLETKKKKKVKVPKIKKMSKKKEPKKKKIKTAKKSKTTDSPKVKKSKKETKKKESKKKKLKAAKKLKSPKAKKVSKKKSSKKSKK
ncbi:MAG: hypothetical protein ACNI3C_09565 [Candidatus Marinarcus sp.]|uniref:hypothetical protein n=1 Tax=Candidatus Marinarcus sp. TaxID=3100987 RepID=UPI003B00F19A